MQTHFLKHVDSDVRESIARALGAIGPEAKVAVPALAAQLEDIDRAVRTACTKALGQIGPNAAAAVPRLIELFNDKDYGVREAVCRALGQIGAASTPALPGLMKQLQDDRGSVRLAALNKMELLPWDGWGLMTVAEEHEAGPASAVIDKVADAIVADAWLECRGLYEEHDLLRVPEAVVSYRAGTTVALPA